MDIRKLAIEKLVNAGIFNSDEKMILAFTLGYQEGNARPPIMINTIESYRSEIMSNTSFRDILCMQQRLSIEDYEHMVSEFIQLQMANRKIYSNSSEVFNHIRNWIAYQKKNYLEKKSKSNKKEGLL